MPRRPVHLDGRVVRRASALKTPRLTGGAARGRPLAEVPPAGVRPTSARVREALFSIVGQELGGSRILDACAGSGLLGLEAWSRGASVVAVEQNAKTYRRLRQNIEALGASVTPMRGDVVRLATGLGTFDGIVVDPPYALDPTPLVDALGPCTTDWLVLESDANRPPPEVDALAIDRRRTYGGTSLTLYRRRPS